MKKLLFPLLFVSLGLNALFALIFGLGATAPATPEAVPLATITAVKPAAPDLNAEVWPKLQTDNYPDLISRLKAAGFPPDMIRAIIAAQISLRYKDRIKALQPPNERLPFWKTAKPNPANDLALRQLYRQQNKELTDLLGDDLNSTDNLYLTQQGGRLDFLPPQKADDIRRLVRDYLEQKSDLYASGSYDTIRDKITALDKAQHDAIAQKLSPAELLDYDLRNSSAARGLRSSLAAFNPSEEEFRAIYQASAAYNAKYDGASGFIALSPEQARERTAAQEELKTQIKALLTPERAAEYVRSEDYYYRETDKLVTRLELPRETTLSLWNMKQDAEKRRAEINSTTPEPEARTAALRTLQQETVAKAAQILGSASRVDTYKGYGGGWLENLAPRPGTPKPKG